MSATNRGSERLAQDAYTTPGYVVDALLEHINFDKGTCLSSRRGQALSVIVTMLQNMPGLAGTVATAFASIIG